jgi:hypothetical protein
LIYDDLKKFTMRIFNELEINKTKYPDSVFINGSFINPYNKEELILLPKEILHELPVAKEWEDIDEVCSFNSKLRNEINIKIGKNWKELTVSQKKSKAKNIILNNPEILKDLIRNYKNYDIDTYDFEADSSGEIIWYNVSKQYTTNFPILLKLVNNPQPMEVYKVVKSICETFKNLIENNGLYEVLYYEGKPRKERIAQKIFFSISDSYCRSNNLDLSPETNSGRGPVDFKISKGYNSRVLVEIKLSSNPHLIHGYETQLIEYQKAEKSQYSIYLVIDVLGGFEKKVESILKIQEEAIKRNERIPEIIFINAVPKDSASKF